MNNEPSDMEPRLLTLLQKIRDERDADARVELNQLLRADAAARRVMATSLVNEQALINQLRDQCILSILDPEPVETTPKRPIRWLQWRSLAAAAAGIALGMFCTVVAFGYVAPHVAEKVSVVFNEGFENGLKKTAPGLPRETGVWSGDEAEVVGATTAMKPHGGAKMLRFLSATYPGENSPRSQWGDVYRLVDVRGRASSGRMMARVSANFAQSAAASEGKFSCSVDAMALDEELSALPARLDLAWLRQHSSSAGLRKVALSPGREWTQVSVEAPITHETRYVMLHLAVVRDQPAIESGAVQFGGHFMDDVRVEIITRP